MLMLMFDDGAQGSGQISVSPDKNTHLSIIILHEEGLKLNTETRSKNQLAAPSSFAALANFPVKSTIIN